VECDRAVEIEGDGCQLHSWSSLPLSREPVAEAEVARTGDARAWFTPRTAFEE
jgi:hypothetical protein